MSVSAPQSTTAWLIRHSDRSITLLAPYNDAFIADLKRSVASDYREWRPEEKAWWVDRIAADIAVSIARRHFGGIRVAQEGHHAVSDAQLVAMVRDRWPACDTLGVLPTAPASVIQAAHRALALVHHPDRGGDLRTMQRINDAYDVLREGVA